MMHRIPMRGISMRRIARATSTVGWASALALRAPRQFASLTGALAATVAERRFAEMSPLAALPSGYGAALDQHDVTLPAAAAFERGNQDTSGLAVLVTLAKAIDARTVFEFGTYNGLTALTLARNLPDATVHTLDLPPATRPSMRIFRQDNLHLSDRRSRAYDRTPDATRIVQHLADSARFDFTPYTRCVDLVYIDGAHSFEYVANDSRAAFTMVSDRGAIVWDDYSRAVPDVPRFLHGLRGRRVYRMPGTRLAIWVSDGAAYALAGGTRAFREAA